MTWLPVAFFAALAVWFAVPPAAAARLRPPAHAAWPPPWARPGPDALPAVWRWAAGAIVGFGVAFGLGGGSPLFLLLGGLGCPAVAIGLGRLERGRARERRERLRREAPGALEAIAACLEAGLPLRQATAVVAGLSPPGVGALLHRVGQGVAVGLTDAEAWLGLAGDEVLGPLAKDVARAAGWGTTVGAILTDYAADLRRDLAGEARTRARAVGVRTALPLAACYLPAFVLLGLVPILLAGVFALVGG